MSLSKKINGGFLKINTIQSNVDTQSTPKKDYSSFLNKMKNMKGSKRISFKKNLRKTKYRKKQSIKSGTKNISEISDVIEDKNITLPKDKKKDTSNDNKTTPSKVNNPTVHKDKKNTSNKKKSFPVSYGKTQKESKSTPKRSHKKYKRKNSGRKSISVSNKNSLSKEKLAIIQKKLKDIKSKNKRQMINELKKDGVIVSGKSEKLVKDIYLYSKLCGINIKHEK